MKCKECQYCECIGRAEMQKGTYSYSRKEYFCKNPKVYKMKDEHGYPINNFVGYGNTTLESPLQLKTRKKWCPLESEA